MAIKSLLDNDIYKIFMQYAVLKEFPGTHVRMAFMNRRKTDVLSKSLLKSLREVVNSVKGMKADSWELSHIHKHYPFLPNWYMDWLSEFAPNPAHVNITENGEITVEGPWEQAMWWEIPILYTISELFCGEIDAEIGHIPRSEIVKSTLTKMEILKGHYSRYGEAIEHDPCQYVQFGCRRRRSYDIEDEVVRTMKKADHPNMLGISNIHLAAKYDIRPVGTMAHEFVMGVSALKSLRYANREAMETWLRVFKGELDIFLPDTFGTNVFLKDYTRQFAQAFNATRQDSGSAYEYGEKLINHYKTVKLDPKTKSITFSDGLTATESTNIQQHFYNRIKRAYGIGTHFTNDFMNRPAMNIVMKLTHVNGIPVVKLSDVPGKACGDPNALKAAKWVFLGEPLV
jgi:nicotinate phosphoribosyltransferase